MISNRHIRWVFFIFDAKKWQLCTLRDGLLTTCMPCPHSRKENYTINILTVLFSLLTNYVAPNLVKCHLPHVQCNKRREMSNFVSKRHSFDKMYA